MKKSVGIGGILFLLFAAGVVIEPLLVILAESIVGGDFVYSSPGEMIGSRVFVGLLGVLCGVFGLTAGWYRRKKKPGIAFFKTFILWMSLSIAAALGRIILNLFRLKSAEDIISANIGIESSFLIGNARFFVWGAEGVVVVLLVFLCVSFFNRKEISL